MMIQSTECNWSAQHKQHDSQRNTCDRCIQIWTSCHFWLSSHCRMLLGLDLTTTAVTQAQPGTHTIHSTVHTAALHCHRIIYSKCDKNSYKDKLSHNCAYRHLIVNKCHDNKNIPDPTYTVKSFKNVVMIESNKNYATIQRGNKWFNFPLKTHHRSFHRTADTWLM